MKKKVSTPHNNFVVVSQEDSNPLPSTADASPQICLVQSSAIWEQISQDDVLSKNKYSDYAVYTLIIMVVLVWFSVVQKLLSRIL